MPEQDLSILAGSAGSWDSNHVCDPTVVAAKATYAGTTYSLAMFYLGTDQANSRNQIGVAFFNSFGGPWVKYPLPIVETPFLDARLWGVGMPSATTVDFDSGRVLLSTVMTPTTATAEAARTTTGSRIMATTGI